MIVISLTSLANARAVALQDVTLATVSLYLYMKSPERPISDNIQGFPIQS